MKIGGIILSIIGGLLTILGVAANSSNDLKLISFLSGNGTNPGMPLIIIGIILLAGGIALIVFASKKKQK